MKPDLKTIGQRLKSLRLDRKLTLRALEKLSGVSNSQIYNIEQAKFAASIETLFKICEGLDVTLRDILEDRP